MAVTLFELNGFSYRYETEGIPPEERSEVLSDVTCRIPEGGVVAVIGPSGCGKSTLLNSLGLLLEDRIPEGRVQYHDMDYSGLDRKACTALRRSDFGFVLQSCYLLANFTCLQNVAMPLALFGWTETERDEWAQAVIAGADPRGDLTKRLHHLPRHVSLGQKQRMAVLRAIVHDPSVVFADEPTSNLDPESTRAILDLLRDWISGTLYREGLRALESQPGKEALRQKLIDLRARHDRPKTLFFVCHHLETARASADHVLLFDKHHRLVAQFRRAEWPLYEQRVHEILKSSAAPPASPPARVSVEATAIDADNQRSHRRPASTVPNSSPGRQLRFAAWFARTELWAVGSRLVTWAMIVAIMLSSLGSVISITIPEVTRRVNLAELEANPFSQCLWVSGRGYDRQINEDRRKRVEHQISDAGVTATVAAYHETDYELPDAQAAGLALPKGRVVAPSDPLYHKLATLTVHGRSFQDLDAPAVILSARLVPKLGTKETGLPAELRFRAPQTGEYVPVKTIDVSREPLPQGDLYYLNEAADEQLRRHDFSVGRTDRVLTGPVPEGWRASWDELPRDVQDALNGWNIQPPVASPMSDPVANADRTHWILASQSEDQKLSSQVWLGYLQRIESLMVAAGRKGGSTFAVVNSVESDPLPAPPRGDFDRMIVYSQSLGGLRPTAEAIEQMGLYVNDSAIQQLQLIDVMAERQRVVSYALTFLFCGGAVLSLFLMLFLRSRQKAPQIGMLRALGADDGTLARISAMEAGMIWVRGTALSLVTGSLIVVVLWQWGKLSPGLLKEALFDARCGGILAAYFAVSLVACLGSGWFASRPFRKASPAFSLGLGN
jgi:putative ABC transport system ATP-binding protein